MQILVGLDATNKTEQIPYGGKERSLIALVGEVMQIKI
jgi:hypothetical protein